ncbi:MAG: hypothetical protein RSF40_09855 [Oscillospiraceae bacterium]
MLRKIIQKNKIIIWTLLFVIGAVITIIWSHKEKVIVDQTPQYMIEIRVENKTEERFENLKFGISDGNNTLIEDIYFEETDENVASFWVGYNSTTNFYLKIRTSDSFVENMFDIKEKDQVNNPQLLSLIVIEDNGVLKIQEYH